MASQPPPAWVLLLGLLAGCLPAGQPRDFTVKDIVYLHPSTTPYPHGFKCFTCEKAADNYECNRWAPDVYCPRAQADLIYMEIPHSKYSQYSIFGQPVGRLTTHEGDDGHDHRGTRYCFSQHMMKVTGESVSVTKRCVPLEDCLSTGCTYVKHEEYKICTSCCEGSICNLPLPRNTTDAVFTTLSPLNKTQRLSRPVLLTTACLWLGLVSQRWATRPC